MASFGRKLGDAFRDALVKDRLHHQQNGTPEQSWINLTCDAIGFEPSEGEEAKLPPSAAIEEFKRIMAMYTKAILADPRFTRLTNIDAHLLESWLRAAGDPDDQVFLWLTEGAPAGILYPIVDPGIFPETSEPSENRPEDLHCDVGTFRNYAGVEDQDITEEELLAHLGKEHLIAFDTHAELSEHVGGEPILNTIGFIEKVCNGKESSHDLGH